MKAIAHHLSGRKKLITVGAVILVLVALVTYVLWGNAAWSDYHASYDQRKSDVKTGLESALKMSSGTAEARAAKFQALSSVSARFAGSGISCDVNGIISWQQGINGTYKKWRDDCAATQASVATLDDELTTAIAYLRSERELSRILSTALETTDKKITEKSFSSVLSAWKTVGAKLAELDGPSEFTPVKSKAQKAVDGVVAAWQAVVTAHTAKDESKFEGAIKALTPAYSSIDGMESVSVIQLKKISEAVQSRYNAL